MPSLSDLNYNMAAVLNAAMKKDGIHNAEKTIIYGLILKLIEKYNKLKKKCDEINDTNNPGSVKTLPIRPFSKNLYTYSTNNRYSNALSYYSYYGSYGSYLGSYSNYGYSYSYSNPSNILDPINELLEDKPYPDIKFIAHKNDQLKNTGISLDIKILKTYFPNSVAVSFDDINVFHKVKVNFFLEHPANLWIWNKSDIENIFKTADINIILINQEQMLVSYYDYNKIIHNEAQFLQYFDLLLTRHQGALNVLKEWQKGSNRDAKTFLHKDNYLYQGLGDIPKPPDHELPFLVSEGISSTPITTGPDLNIKVLNTGFTSPIKCNQLNYNNLLKNKNYTKYAHLAGKSFFKNTTAVINAFIKNKSSYISKNKKLYITCTDGPNAFCWSTLNKTSDPSATDYEVLKDPNNPSWNPERVLEELKKADASDPSTTPSGQYKDLIEIYLKRVPDAQFSNFFSEYGVHICTSTAEGYGHYINDAKYCGNIIITTDHSPMIEHVIDYSKNSDEGNAFVVKSVNKVTIGSLGDKRVNIRPDDIAKAIEDIDNLSEEDKKKMSINSHLLFLKERIFFEGQIKKLADFIYSKDPATLPNIATGQVKFSKTYKRDPNGEETYV